MTFIKRERPARLDCWPNHTSCDHRDYIGRAVTLNGQPAKVTKDATGRSYVAPLNPNHGTVPYSWVAIFNVIDNRNSRFE